jgi:hypothetical protein
MIKIDGSETSVIEVPALFFGRSLASGLHACFVPANRSYINVIKKYKSNYYDLSNGQFMLRYERWLFACTMDHIIYFSC